jgi:uncharacterized protein (DUF427 family)
MRVRAICDGMVVADSDDTVVVVEGNLYFPPESLRDESFTASRSRSLCRWKGIAGYYPVTVDGAAYPDAAWCYRHPTPLARRIRGRVAFSPPVRVVEVGDWYADGC